jgi:general secretion pathway protein I
MLRSNRFADRAGFTLLEVLVASAIMGIAVAALLSNLTASISNAARLTETDRAALLARRKMDELLVDRRIPRMVEFRGVFPPGQTSGNEAGWRARVAPVEFRAGPAPGERMIERIELEVWWKKGTRTRNVQLEAYRIATLKSEEMSGLVPKEGAR